MRARTAAIGSAAAVIWMTCSAPKVRRRCDLVVAFNDSDHVQAGQLGGVHEHEADGAGSDDDDRCRPAAAFDSSRPRTTQASGSVRAACSKGTVSGTSRVFFSTMRRGNGDVFGVGSVVEEQVVAEVLLIAAAEVAVVAGGGIEGDDAVADAESGDGGADFVDNSGKLVAERTWAR